MSEQEKPKVPDYRSAREALGRACEGAWCQIHGSSCPVLVAAARVAELERERDEALRLLSAALGEDYTAVDLAGD